jgi:predicted ArsR family transcriptional regulator
MYLRHNDVVEYVGLASTASGDPGGDAGQRAACAQATAPAQATAAQSGSERGTRARIARLILENGPATATALSTRLGLTPAAIRRHLDNLLADGMIESQTARTYGTRGRGRPARLFAITDAGRSAFEHAYDDLATSALRYLAERAGPEAVGEFARRQIADLENRYRKAVGSGSPSERVRALAEALSADGYAASAGGAPAETEAFGRLLGTPVQRLATIAHGDGVCTTHVTPPSLMRSRTTANATTGTTTRTTPGPTSGSTAHITASKSGGISA